MAESGKNQGGINGAGDGTQRQVAMSGRISKRSGGSREAGGQTDPLSLSVTQSQDRNRQPPTAVPPRASIPEVASLILEDVPALNPPDHHVVQGPKSAQPP